jgi:tetratricopeptide (TPR) repeat protein
MAIFIAGCSGAFKKRWDNFTAYYNTYYNAEVLVTKNERAFANAKLVLNTERPIRIWEPPTRAGAADFDKAILKGAAVLRDHPGSKWADDAVLLIGKSYFYLTQYFSAEQKFDEALTTAKSSTVLKEAVFWKGRVQLEMKRYREGVETMQRRLGEGNFAWSATERARINALSAQMLVEEGNIEQALVLLREAAPKLKDDVERGKAFFLLGQLAERRKQAVQARAAYEQVVSPVLDYELRFRARLRLAEIERETGRLNNALKMFQQMARDDKNFDIVTDLNYEIGRTYQRMRKPQEAVSMYRLVLSNKQKPPSLPTKAKTYYALGELARYDARDFRSAAVWFDSAAKATPDLSKLPEGFNAAELSRSFGDYVRMKTEIRRADSLLWLGSLSPAAFDSVIETIRKKRLAEMEEELKKREKQANTAVIVGGANQQAGDAQNQQNGFLNHKNPALVTQGMTQFKAVWGNRPLVDNWRRIEAVRMAASQSAETDPKKNGAAVQAEGPALADLKIDLKAVPFSQRAKDSLLKSRSFRYYELANLFFLNLNEPDSAERIYRKILSEPVDAQVESGSYYILAELLSAVGKETEAREMATRLVVRYPNSELAQRAVIRFKFASADSVGKPVIDPKVELFSKAVKTLDANDAEHAHAAVSGYAADFKDTPQAGELWWQLAQKYVDNAKRDGVWIQKKEKAADLTKRYEEDANRYQILSDSLNRRLKSDTTLTTADSTAIVSALEAKPVQLSVYETFTYTGALWDSARVVLNLFASRYTSHPSSKRAAVLLSEIKLPAPQHIQSTQLDAPCVLLSPFTSLVETHKPEKLSGLKKSRTVYRFTVEVSEVGTPDRVLPKDPKEGDEVPVEIAAFLEKHASFTVPKQNGIPAKTTVEITATW